MGDLAGRFLIADFAGAVEPGTRFNDQLADGDGSRYLAVGDNFQPLGVDRAVKLPADQNDAGGDFTFEPTFLADRYLAVGFDLALDLSVDMQTVA